MNDNHCLKQNSTKKFLLEEECNILKTAIAEMNIHVFVYDICLKKIYFFSSNARPFGVLNEMDYTIEDILNHGIIDANYTTIFRSLFHDVESGSNTSNALFKLCTTDSSEVWNYIMLTNCSNHGKPPIRAIGTIQDVSKRIQTEQRYTKETQYRLAMMADSRRVYEINVTKNRFIKLESIQDSTDYGSWNLYTETMDTICKNNIYPDDWDTFLDIATRDHLIEGYNKGITEFYCEYRFINDTGNIAWSSSSTHLLKDPLSNDIKGFIYVKDIDKQKKLELKLSHQAEHDPLTGIYNRGTAEQSISQILASSTSKQLHGFLIIDFDDFKLVNDNFGHINGDILLKQMAQSVSELIRPKDIFARMGGDEFIVFLPDANGFQEIDTMANSICSCIHSIHLEGCPNFSSSVSIGIALYPCHGTTFTELYKNSDIALYQVKAQGKNNTSVFSK